MAVDVVVVISASFSSSFLHGVQSNFLNENDCHAWKLCHTHIMIFIINRSLLPLFFSLSNLCMKFYNCLHWFIISLLLLLFCFFSFSFHSFSDTNTQPSPIHWYDFASIRPNIYNFKKHIVDVEKVKCLLSMGLYRWHYQMNFKQNENNLFRTGKWCVCRWFGVVDSSNDDLFYFFLYISSRYFLFVFRFLPFSLRHANLFIWCVDTHSKSEMKEKVIEKQLKTKISWIISFIRPKKRSQEM